MQLQNQYCAYTQDPESVRLALDLIKSHSLQYEIHIQRTRFWVDVDTELDTYCALRFKCVNHETNHSLGI